MTITTTPNFGFIAVYNAVPSAGDWAATYWNWIFADRIMYSAAIGHTHNGAAALQNPTGTIVVTTSSSGGYLGGGLTYYFAVTYVDALTRETAASTVVSVTTAATISAPATPTIDDDATPTDIEQSTPTGLSGGDYWYKLSYLKAGGESLPSSPVYVQIPTDALYQCTIHFDSLTTVGNGADTIRVYRKIGSSGSWVKIADITNTATNSWTDDNTAVPSCDTNPKTVSTINSFNSITIDWSALDYTNAEYVKIYATTTEGIYTENSLVATVTMNDATPVTSYVWTGSARAAGKPPEISNCYGNPTKINLTNAAEIQGYLPWANLPSDFTWQQSVATYASLPEGTTGGEARVVEDENSIYVWDENAATPEWTKVAGLKEVEDYDDLPASGLEEVEHGWVGEATTSKIVDTGFLMATSFEGNGTTALKAYVLAQLYGHDEGDTFTVDIRATSAGHPAASALYTETYTLTADDIATWGYSVIEFDFGMVTLTEGATYWLTYSNNDDIYVARPTSTTKSRWESNDGGTSWTEYVYAGLSYKLVWGTVESYADAYLVTNEGDIYIWSDYAAAWNQVGKKVLVIDSNPIDWTEVDSVPGVAHGDFLLATVTGNGGSRDKLAGLYAWRGDWATPAWQLLNTFLPPDFGNANNYGEVPDGCAWLAENWAEDGMTFYYRYDGSTHTFPLDVEYIATYNGYYGWYDTVGELESEPAYGYGAVAFIWADKCFYYYDDDLDTPAWVKHSDPLVKQSAIIDVVEDSTPTKEQLKINEILTALRTAGIIET